MGVQWTKEQQEVIRMRDRNILVSAAAGSGKTAVLVERILSKITDKEHPVDIDRLLIMTFTRAAAGEMKDKKKEMIEKTAQEFQKLNGDNQMFILGYMLGIQQERQRTTPQPQTA